MRNSIHAQQQNVQQMQPQQLHQEEHQPHNYVFVECDSGSNVNAIPEIRQFDMNTNINQPQQDYSYTNAISQNVVPANSYTIQNLHIPTSVQYQTGYNIPLHITGTASSNNILDTTHQIIGQMTSGKIDKL